MNNYWKITPNWRTKVCRYCGRSVIPTNVSIHEFFDLNSYVEQWNCPQCGLGNRDTKPIIEK